MTNEAKSEGHGNLVCEEKSKVACTVCRESERLARYEVRADKDGRLVELWQCLECHAVLNMTDLQAVMEGFDDTPLQAMSSDNFYAVTSDFIENLHQTINKNTMVDFLLEKVPSLKRGVFVDFGAGQGITSAAAARQFAQVYAVELSLNVLRQVHEYMPLKEKIYLTDDISIINHGYDVVASMHVLEHIVNLRDLLELLVSGLIDGGALFFQVPMLRSDYIVPVHYTFFNEVCLNNLARHLKMELTGVWYDTNLDFLTCIMRK